MKKKWIFLQGFALLTAIASCAISLAGCEVVSKPEPIAVESVTLDTESFTLELSYDRRLTATVTPYNADDKTVTWSSSNADVATVIDGRVISQGPGTATITARAGGKFATCTVTVRPQPVPVNSISLDNNNLTLGLDEKRKIVATVFPDDADDKTVTWRSENPSVATVDEDGTVTAIAEGQAYIYAQAGEMGAYCTVIVKGKEEEGHIAVESVTLDTDTLTIEPGDMRALTATVMPYNASDKTVIWTSSDETVATVNEYGMVTAIAPGIATITAKAGDKTATCSVTVKKILIPVTYITINKHDLTITYGETGKLTATVLPDNADDKTVAWSSDDSSIATVDSDGNVTAVKAGTANITAEAGGKTATCTVTVNPVPVENITLDATNLLLAPNMQRELVATLTPEDADGSSVTWSSSNMTVATVDDNGTVKAVAVGTATITAKAGDFTATCEVTVKPDTITVESITLNKNTLTLTRGKQENLTATVTPSNADDKTVTWSSSDTAIAKVDNSGTVTAVKAGTATITVRAGGKVTTCTVTVNPIPVESITLNKNTLTLTLPRSKTEKLTATVTPDNADNRTVTWTSNNASVAKVDNNGTVTAVKAGTATITAALGDFTAECKVTVNTIPVESITLDATTLMFAPNMSKKLTATVTPDDAFDKTIIWSSSNTDVATVVDGTITAHKAGTATITAQASGKTATCEITVHTDHSYSRGKCTVCGAKPYLEGGTIDDKGVLTKYRGDASTVVIPDGVTGIGSEAFYYNTILTSVSIPTSVTSIGKYAFKECKNIETVIYGGTLADWCGITWISSDSNPLSNENAVLYINNEAVTNAVIPDNVKEIKSYAFYCYTSLASVTIPDSVTSIGESAFWYCTSLADVTIPDSVTSIGNFAFSGCASLANVTIPDSVTSIGKQAFSYCTSLTDVTIPDSVTSIGDFAFSGCTNLTSVKISDNVTTIGNGTFRGCKNLTSVKIPGRVTSIEAETFGRCIGLKSVDISSGVTTIGRAAFNNCTSLTSVKIPDSVTSIKDNAFYDCTKLAYVTIPDGVTSIGNQTFSGCTKLMSVTYKGTEEQWENINNISFSGLADKTIKGSDGSTWTAK